MLRDMFTSGVNTLNNFSCNLCCDNLIATQVARKLPGVTMPLFDLQAIHNQYKFPCAANLTQRKLVMTF